MRKGPDAFGVGVLETVQGLVIVSDDAKGSFLAQQVYHSLFCLVQILILVNQNMVIQTTLWSSRVITKITIQLWNNLSDQHSLMKSQPPNQALLKIRVHLCLRESGLLVLEASPGRFVRTNKLLPLPLTPEFSWKIVQQRLNFKSVQG